jgi:hypothetical protein
MQEMSVVSCNSKGCCGYSIYRCSMIACEERYLYNKKQRPTYTAPNKFKTGQEWTQDFSSEKTRVAAAIDLSLVH